MPGWGDAASLSWQNQDSVKLTTPDCSFIADPREAQTINIKKSICKYMLSYLTRNSMPIYPYVGVDKLRMLN